MWNRRHDPLYENMWKSDFRMSAGTFAALVEKVRVALEKRDTNFRKAIPVEKRVAIAIWRLSTGNSYRTVAKTFGVAKSTAIKITKKFCKKVCQISSEFIKFPKRQETPVAIKMFRRENNSKIPQAVGAIDATHIFIKGPNSESRYDYFCRKQRYSINTQAVVGHNLLFFHIATGFPGSIHDSRILRHTSLYHQGNNNEILAEPIHNINGFQVQPLLLGDGAYPLLKWLMKPYSLMAALTAEEKKFNECLSSSRSVVERAFGILKARWRCLLVLLDANLENVSDTIISCFTLHNFCQIHGEIYEDDELLNEIINQERANRRRRNWNNDALQDGERIRSVLKDYINEG